MAAIITTPFRVLNAENFKEDVAGSNVYIGIGKSDVWSTTTSDLTDTTPFVPGDHRDAINEAHQQMIGMKKVAAADVSHVVPRYDYADGLTFVAWDSDDSDIFDKKFYVITSEFKVYKLLKAGASVTSAQPVHTSEVPTAGADGYTWKYMYTVTTASSEKFLTTSYMPVKTLAESPVLASTAVDFPQQSSQINSRAHANAAGIERIEVTAPGSSYETAPTVTITGDGTGATATAVVSGGAVTAVNVTAKGTDYTIVDITFSGGGGADAAARAPVSPVNGHGTDPVGELGAFFVGVNTQLDGDESGDLTVGNDFRQVTIVKNPTNAAGALLSSDTLKGLKYLQLTSGSSTTNFVIDQVIVGGTSGAKAYLAEISSTNKRLFYYQNSKTGFAPFQNGEGVTGTLPTGGSATTHASAALVAAEYKKGSGQMIFLENRAPINRTASQIEDIKCIIEF